MRKKARIVSSEEDDLTLSKSPPSNKKYKMNTHDFYDGLSEDYYSSPKRSSRRYDLERRKSSRLGVSRDNTKKLKYALRSVASVDKDHSSNADETNHEKHDESIEKNQHESDDSINDLENGIFHKHSHSTSNDSSKISDRKPQRLTRSQREEFNDSHFNKSPLHESEESAQDVVESAQDAGDSQSDSDDEVWEEEDEEEEDDFLDLDLGDNMRMTRSRKSFYPKKNNDGRSLRKKTPVNYASQMYPQAFKDVDALVELDRNNNLPMGFNQKNSLNRSWGFNMPRTPSKLFRLNEVCKTIITARMKRSNRLVPQKADFLHF